MTFSIDSTPGAKGYVIAVGGAADTTAAPAFEQTVQAAVRTVLAEGRERTIVVDLSSATFVDSRMIGSLVTWVEDLAAKGWRIPLVCEDPNMLRVFRAIGLEQTFDIHDTLESAET